VVQAGAIGGIADVHARTFAHSLQTFEDLDAGFAISLIDALGDDFFIHYLCST
jgi:hypothetical protein